MFQLAFEKLEQGKSIGSAAGESGNHAAVGQGSDFAGVTLHHRVAHADLAVTGNCDLAVAAHRDNGCPSKLFHLISPSELLDGTHVAGAAATAPNCKLSAFVFDSCPWVGLVVYLGQVLEVKVCIHLGGADIRVAQ